MLVSIKDFFVKYYKIMIAIVVGLFILYWFIYFATPKNQMSEVDKYKIQLIDEKIEKIDQSQKRIDSTISELNKELIGLNKTISTIKKQKVIVKKVYDEKINRVDELNDAQLDSFFSDRY